MGEVGGRGQERDVEENLRYVEENLGCGGQGGWYSERTSGGAGEVRPPALMDIAHRKGFRLGGIEHGALVEVVGEGFLGDLLCFPTDGAHGELDLGWSPGGMGEGGRSGLSDMGQDLCDGLRVGKGPERSGDRRRGGGEGVVRGGNAMNVRGAWQVGQTKGNTSKIRARRVAHLDGWVGVVSGSGAAGLGDGLAGSGGGGVGIAESGRPGSGVLTSRALSGGSRAVPRGLRGALGANPPW